MELLLVDKAFNSLVSCIDAGVDAKLPSKPGSRETWMKSVSPEPGLRDARINILTMVLADDWHKIRC